VSSVVPEISNTLNFTFFTVEQVGGFKVFEKPQTIDDVNKTEAKSMTTILQLIKFLKYQHDETYGQ
jgi:hypothetical protein